MPNATFPPTLPELQASVWSWTQAQNPAAELYKLLQVLAAKIDQLGDQIDVIWQSRSINTAQPQDLTAQYAFAWGLLAEQLPPTAGALAAYILARAIDNGSQASLVNILTQFITSVPTNLTGGAILTFDPGGQGLTFPDPAGTNLVFPMSGGIILPTNFGNQPPGLTLYQFTPGAGPSTGLTFPAQGGGLLFPLNPLIGVNPYLSQANDGTVGIGGGPGLVFSTNGYITILSNNPVAYSWIVQVKSYLTFDRGAFQRAMERDRPAHCLPGVLQEINTT